MGRFAVIGLVLAAWHLAAVRLGPVLAPSPAAVFEWTIREAARGDLLWQAFTTWYRAALGLLLGVPLALVLPLILSRMGATGRLAEPMLLATAGLPKYAMVPLFVMWFGIDDTPTLILVALLTFYPVFIGTSAGLRAVDQRLVDAVRVLGASRVAAAREVLWHSMLPFWFAGFQIALPRAMSAAVIGEMLIGDEGLGFRIEHARQTFDTLGVFGNLLMATLCIIGMNAALDLAVARLTRWKATQPTLVI